MSPNSRDNGYSNVGEGEKESDAQELRGARRAVNVRVHEDSVTRIGKNRVIGPSGDRVK